METMNAYMPTRVITGEGCVRKAQKEFASLGRVCLVLTGKTSAKESGALADVECALQKGEVGYAVWDGIGQNPSFDQCVAAANQAVAIGAEFIIGIGGGSPMDAAKAVAVLAANDGMSQEEFYSANWKKKPLLIALVGTTAGTGSEVTKVAVITNRQGRKIPLRDDRIYATYALGDPMHTMSLSDGFTRSTAVDALAHCVESYFSPKANELSRTYALRGIALLKQVFDRVPAAAYGVLSYRDRETLYHGSIYGGLAINITGTAMPHALGYFLTERLGLPHGVACAVFLPGFLERNERIVPELTEPFFKEIGCTREDFLEMLGKVTPEYPVSLTREELEKEQNRWNPDVISERLWARVSMEEIISAFLQVSRDASEKEA